MQGAVDRLLLLVPLDIAHSLFADMHTYQSCIHKAKARISFHISPKIHRLCSILCINKMQASYSMSTWANPINEQANFVQQNAAPPSLRKREISAFCIEVRILVTYSLTISYKSQAFIAGGSSSTVTTFITYQPPSNLSLASQYLYPVVSTLSILCFKPLLLPAHGDRLI